MCKEWAIRGILNGELLGRGNKMPESKSPLGKVDNWTAMDMWFFFSYVSRQLFALDVMTVINHSMKFPTPTRAWNRTVDALPLIKCIIEAPSFLSLCHSPRWHDSSSCRASFGAPYTISCGPVSRNSKILKELFDFLQARKWNFWEKSISTSEVVYFILLPRPNF